MAVEYCRDDVSQVGTEPTVHLELVVSDPESVAELSRHQPGEPRTEFALRALRIGILALRQARGAVDQEAIRREADRLLESLEAKLTDHTGRVHDRLATVLQEYFDPQSGRFEDRLQRLIRKDGELESLLRRQIGDQDSELCRTFSAHVGDGSWLMNTLDPARGDGLLATLRKSVQEQLHEQREHVLRQFSLDDEQSALSRCVRELTRNHGELTEKLRSRMDDVVKEFSLDEEDSALSRLVRNVERAQRTITSEFSLDHEQSALARLRREVLNVMKLQQEEHRKFHDEVKATLQAMVVRKAESLKSTRHGLEFEEAVFQFLQHDAQAQADIATATGNSVGRIKNCKVGDAVLELGADKAAAGARIVIEAKQKQSVGIDDARQELEVACKNRDAQIGLFVFSRSTAPDGLDVMQRIGRHVFVVWDAEDATTDVYLKTGLILARALCLQQKHEHDSPLVDIEQLDHVILEIERRAKMLDNVERSANTIKSSSEKILEESARIRNTILKQVEQLQALNRQVRVAMRGVD